MASLSTTYLGLKLRNPLVVSSSSMTDGVEKLKRLEEAGAGAVVLKSLFEEQLLLEGEKLSASLDMTEAVSAEARGYFAAIPFRNDASQYLELIEDSRRAVQIPVIASLNAVHRAKWGQLARQLESAGASALELNLYEVVADPARTAAEVEQGYLDVVAEVRAGVKLPLSVKLSPFFTSLPNVVAGVARRGAEGVSLFNRFHQPNLDLEGMGTSSRLEFSRPEDALLAMRWIGLLYGRIPGLQFAATGGIHEGKCALKVIAAGAQVAMVCSTLFKNGPRYLREMLTEMQAWLTLKEYASVDDLRGALSQKNNPDPQAYERAQYIKLLVGHD